MLFLQPQVWTNLRCCSFLGILSSSMSFSGKIILLSVWHFNLFHSSPFDIPAQSYSIRWQPCPGNSCGAESRQIAWKMKRNYINTSRVFLKQKSQGKLCSQCRLEFQPWHHRHWIKFSALNFPQSVLEHWAVLSSAPGDAQLGSERILWEIWVIPVLNVLSRQWWSHRTSWLHIYKSSLPVQTVTLPLKIICDSTLKKKTNQT